MGKSEMVVKEEDLVRSGGGMEIDVLSTPRLVQLLEEAAIDAIRELVPPDQWSVGATMKVNHLSPTPPGMKVTAHALLKGVEGSRLTFVVDAYDAKEKIADGEHVRVLVSKEKFLQKAERKTRP